MIYICVQPDIAYFHWQIEVMLNNFRKIGISSKCHIVFLFEKGKNPSLKGKSISRDYSEVEFFFYQDEREDKSYIPSIKPHGMYLHYRNLPYLCESIIFYHDSDIILREKLDLDKFLEDEIWYLSDTVSYIGYDYVRSKGEDQAIKMSEIVGVDIDIIKANQENSGGAQYLMKNVPLEYWSKVTSDSISLYKWLSFQEKYWKGKDYPIQKWCAEMWSTLWNMWFYGKKTLVDKELDFCFATAPIEDYFKCKILHNAGVTVENKDKMFFKGDFITKNPFEVDLSYVEKDYCSYEYSKVVESVAQLKKSN